MKKIKAIFNPFAQSLSKGFFERFVLLAFLILSCASTASAMDDYFYNLVEGDLPTLFGTSWSMSICPICRKEIDEYERTTTLSCGHDFHTGCIKIWENQSGNITCPLCYDIVAESEQEDDTLLECDDDESYEQRERKLEIVRGILMETLVRPKIKPD